MAISWLKAVLICLVLLSFAVAAMTSTDLGESWIGRFDLECELRKAQFYVGEPVVVKLRWRNQSIIPMGVAVWWWDRDALGYYKGFDQKRDFDLSVLRDGKEVAREQVRIGHMRPNPRCIVQPLLPGYEIERVVRLEWHFDVAKPGEYLLRVSYKPCYPEGKPYLKARLLYTRFRTVVETPFEVIPWREDPLSDARELAAAGDPGGFHLLGLHGGVEVVPLLVSGAGHEDKEVRYEAARALARIGGSEAVKGLGELAVAEQDPMLKWKMFHTLMRMDTPEKQPWLMLALEDTLVVDVSDCRRGKQTREYSLRSSVASHLENQGVDVEVVEEETLECTDEKGYSTWGFDPWADGYSRLDGG